MPSIVVGFQFFIYSCKLHPNFMSIHYLEQHVKNIQELNVPSLQTRMGGFETKDHTCGSTAVTADSSWGSNPNIQPSKSTTCPSPPQSKSSFSCWQILYLFNLPQNFSYWPNESSLLELLHCSDKQSLCSNRAPYSISTPCSEP